MNATVQKWGNSLALRIPKAFATDIHVRRGTVVEMRLVDGKLEVKPKLKDRPGLLQLLHRVTRKNLHVEHDWGVPVGREAW